jgi:hypothetical protein
MDMEDPDLVVLEPPCHRWSRRPEFLGGGDSDILWERRAEHFPLWKFVRKVWDHRTSRGRLVLTDQPRDARSLDLACMETRPGLASATVAQCRFGLKDPASGLLYRKLTRLDSNDEVFTAKLEKDAECICDDKHAVILGETVDNGVSVKKSAVAGRWTNSFAKHILRSARETIFERRSWRTEDNERDVWNCYVALHEACTGDPDLDFTDEPEIGDEDDDAMFQKEVRTDCRS